jgi:hypothetical protein
MDRRELGIEIIRHTEEGFINVSQMVVACAALALKYGDSPYKGNKKAIEAQIKKYEAEIHKVKKSEDPRKVDTNEADYCLTELFADCEPGSPGDRISGVMTNLLVMLKFYKQISIYAAQFAVGLAVQEILETKITNLIDQYSVTIASIKECIKKAPLLYEIASIKEFEESSRINELEKLKIKLFE